MLRFKDFKLDEAFDRRLNPQGHEPVRMRAPRRFDAVLWIGVAAIVCVAGFTAWWWFGERDLRQQMRSAVAVRPEIAAGTADPAAADSLAAASQTTQQLTTPQTTQQPTAPQMVQQPATPQPTASQTAQTPARTESGQASTAGAASLVSGRSYVVMGVFSSEANARRAAAEAATKEREVAIACGIYRFGSKFMVSPFESDDAEACRLFIRAHEERFPGMWTYTAR